MFKGTVLSSLSKLFFQKNPGSSQLHMVVYEVLHLFKYDNHYNKQVPQVAMYLPKMRFGML